jgi:hypothetical protein
VIANFEDRDLVADAQGGFFRDRDHLHAETADVGARACVDGSEAPQRLVGFRRVPLAGCLVDVGHLAACRAAGDIILVVADLDAAPGVFVVGFWAGDDEVGSESGGGEAGGSFDLGHLTLNVPDAGQVDKMERILNVLVELREEIIVKLTASWNPVTGWYPSSSLFGAFL